MCWHLNTRHKSGPVTTDLTTTVVHSYKLLINDVKPQLLRSLTHPFLLWITHTYIIGRNSNRIFIWL